MQQSKIKDSWANNGDEKDASIMTRNNMNLNDLPALTMEVCIIDKDSLQEREEDNHQRVLGANETSECQKWANTNTILPLENTTISNNIIDQIGFSCWKNSFKNYIKQQRLWHIIQQETYNFERKSKKMSLFKMFLTRLSTCNRKWRKQRRFNKSEARFTVVRKHSKHFKKVFWICEYPFRRKYVRH